MTEHPGSLLSAYLDDALGPVEREAVHTHLGSCASCRDRLDVLRATSRLIGALPALTPTRSLVPQLQRAPVWLRPVRFLGSLGTGVFLFFFLASAILNSGSSLGGGSTVSERLAAKGQFGAAASAAASENAQRAQGASVPTALAAPAAPAPGVSTADASVRSASGSASRAPVAVATGAPVAAEPTGPPAFGPPPAVFLGLALMSAVAAFAAHWRLRRR